jgi:hypothetical protein
METKTLTGVGIAIVVVTFLCAFMLRPMKKALDYYLLAGVILLLIMFVVPYFHAHWSVGRKVLISLLSLIVEAGVWVVGFILAGYRIIDRLF